MVTVTGTVTGTVTIRYDTLRSRFKIVTITVITKKIQGFFEHSEPSYSTPLCNFEFSYVYFENFIFIFHFLKKEQLR